MQTADFDHTLFEAGNNEGDKNLLVKFYTKPKEDKTESLEQGRPIYKDVCYVDIRTAGSRNGHVARPATLKDKQRFPRHFAAYENRQEMPTEGTPLTEWSLLTRSQAEEFAFINVKTVEQLANMPDNNAQKFMGGNTLKQKAKDWLEAASAKAGDLKFKELADKTQKENDELKEQLASQGDMLAKLTERLNSMDADKAPDVEVKEASEPSRRRRAQSKD